MERGRAHLSAQVDEIKQAYGIRDDAKPATKQSGCYVATVVYGSYDCPEVWVMRRWRDLALARNAAGRRLVQIYYSYSPRLIATVGDRARFNLLARRALDWLVHRLRRAGFSSDPYEDR
ncbi:CFI-box-CTERM domain-containing protein (plasmid) [Coraliomargarita sp. W4R53]